MLAEGGIPVIVNFGPFCSVKFQNSAPDSVRYIRCMRYIFENYHMIKRDDMK